MNTEIRSKKSVAEGEPRQRWEARNKKQETRKINLASRICLLFLILHLASCIQLFAQGTAAGTTITNGGDAGVSASADQSGDGFVTWSGGGYLAFSATGVVVSTGYGLTALNSPADQNLAAGASAYFAYNFRNIGNAMDSFGISTTALAGWATNFVVTILRDDNQNGAYNAGEDTVIASTALASETSGYFLVRVFAPVGTPDGSSITFRTRVRSQNGAGVEDNWPSFASGDDDRIDEATATVSAAIITLVKGIAVSTDTRPGGFITYVATITNTGSGNATSVVFKDRIPANATYVSGSITLAVNGGADTAKTDASDGDEADYNVTDAGVITVNVGTVNASGGKAIVKFKVRIN